MNKTELIAAIAEKAELSKKDAEKALTGFTEAVTETLQKGDKVQIVGFGTFEARTRAARKGINPLTKEPHRHRRFHGTRFQSRKGIQGFCQISIDR